jgi:uncharacterized protein (DUF1330 family)
MSYYFVASIRIRDDKEYQKYLDGAGEVFARYRGTYLAVDNEVEVIEGQWNYDRSVLIRFDSREDFQAWYQSNDYQEILKYRLSAADCDTILVKGK